jgi:hypothetical protein
MAGLVPAIHVFLCGQDVDARHKAGHDGGGIGTIERKRTEFGSHIRSSFGITSDVNRPSERVASPADMVPRNK